MNTSRALIPGALLLLLTAMTPAVHANHADTLATQTDAIADLADLYVFTDPPCTAVGGSGCEAPPTELIVAVTLNPFATGAEQFSENVMYQFHFENDVGVRSQIDCIFSADQVMTCLGMGGLTASARVGEVGVNGDLRVYAGLRDDPHWFDQDAFSTFEQVGITAYTGKNDGADSLAGFNTLAIVIGIKISAMSGGSTPNHNVHKVWASSERVGGHGINGAITGSWYNPPSQSGQGWVLEVISQGGGKAFLGYFYGYSNDGEQLWMITGANEINGNQATAEVYRTSGSGFGGDFNPGDFALGDVVGSVTFEFEDCNTATVTFTSADTATLADFENPLTRLSKIDMLECALLTAGQVDRMGRPITQGLIPADMRDDYNRNDDPDSWNADYNAAILAGLEQVSLADGNAAWGGFYTAQQWADVLADDRIQIDLAKSQSVDFMTIERNTIEGLDWEDSSGRALDYDIHENLFNVLITSFDPFIDDHVEGNDKPFLNQFPFLAPPH